MRFDLAHCALRRALRLSWQAAIALTGAYTCTLSHAQMALPGEFAVASNGAATYTIPIKVPPGVAGVEPSLSLVYNSQSGNGLLGVGWDLAGLSAITRCPRTSPQDGVKGGIAYDQNDRFCLDARRLMVVAGLYGVAGSEYRAEIDDFSKVVANGTAPAGGPLYFVVKTAAGLTMEYGNTADSRIEAAGTAALVVRTWALNKITDTKGNTLTVSYTKTTNSAGAFDGGYVPSRIDYTSNPRTGLAATNSVEFAYLATRSDIQTTYRGGYGFTTRLVLQSITTKTNGTTVMTYLLGSNTSFSTGRRRMTLVLACPASGPCLPFTSMSFGTESAPTFTVQKSIPEGTTSATIETNGEWQVLDVNGDGFSDLLHLTNLVGEYRIWISKGDGTFRMTVKNLGDGSVFTNGKWLQLDFNNDGLSDLVQMTTNPGDYRVWLSQPDGTFSILMRSTGDGQALTNGKWLQVDVNGDGHVDLIQMTTNPGDYRIWRNNGNGTFTITAANTGDGQALTNGSWQILDVNGDGLTDMIQMTSNPGDYRIWFNNGDGTFQRSGQNTGDGQSLSNGSWLTLDVNGDGLVDMIQMTTNPGDYRVWLNRGNGAFVKMYLTMVGDTGLTNGSWQVTDVNGDGLMDMVHLTTNTADARIWTSKGDGTFTVSAYGSSVDQGLTAGRFLVGDFRGDGYGDMMHVANGGNIFYWGLTRNSRDIPQSITNGRNRNVAWSMKTLPQMLGTAYVKDVPNSATALTIVPAVPVVASVNASNGYGTTRTTTYAYGSARTERNGRGYLGFAWMGSMSDGADHAQFSRNYFRQDFPFTGRIAQSANGVSPTGTSILSGNFTNLSSTRYVYDCFVPANPPIADPNAPMTQNCAGIGVIAPGKRYFVYERDVEKTSFDLNGAPLPRIRTQNLEPDQFGNMKYVLTETLKSTGAGTDHSKLVTNTYYNDVANWYLGRLLKTTVTSTGPTVPSPVVPGSGGLPPAPGP